MREITVKVDDLAKKVLENRNAHQAIFQEACEGYRAKALELLEAHVAEVKAGKITRVVVNLPYPENHVDDYDRVLTMLEMSVDSQVTIDEGTFANYVMDQWAWTKQFLSSNSAYSVTAARLSAP